MSSTYRANIDGRSPHKPLALTGQTPDLIPMQTRILLAIAVNSYANRTMTIPELMSCAAIHYDTETREAFLAALYRLRSSGRIVIGRIECGDVHIPSVSNAIIGQPIIDMARAIRLAIGTTRCEELDASRLPRIILPEHAIGLITPDLTKQ